MSQTTALAGTDRQLEKRVTMFVALGIIFAPLNSTMIAVALPFVIFAVASVGSMVVALGLNSRRGEGSARAR